MMTSDRAAWLSEIAPCAVNAEERTGYPAPAVIAAAAAESGWGKAVTGDYNVFGLTRAVAPEAPQKLCATHERLTHEQVEALSPDERVTVTGIVPLGGGLFSVALSRWFPSFGSLQEAVDCYVELITTGPRYAAAWALYQSERNIRLLLLGIGAAGYASAGGYGYLLCEIQAEPEVAAAIAKARQQG